MVKTTEKCTRQQRKKNTTEANAEKRSSENWIKSKEHTQSKRGAKKSRRKARAYEFNERLVLLVSIKKGKCNYEFQCTSCTELNANNKKNIYQISWRNRITNNDSQTAHTLSRLGFPFRSDDDDVFFRMLRVHARSASVGLKIFLRKSKY